MKTFVIGDIHGGLKALKQLLNQINLQNEDQLIFLGDYVDGWSESAQVIQFLMDLSKTQNCIFIKGNHDVWCEAWLLTDKADKVWLEHGGEGTMNSYRSISDTNKRKHLEFFKNMKPYLLDDQNRLFLHAGFTSMHGVEKETFQSTFYFDRTLWEMALTMDSSISKNSDLYPRRLTHYDEIYIGHTPTINFNSDKPMQAINIWNVDTGAAFYGKLSAIEIDSKQIFQSETLMELYPNEKGRNERSLNEILGKS